jgi:hypothetical protein
MIFFETPILFSYVGIFLICTILCPIRKRGIVISNSDIIYKLSSSSKNSYFLIKWLIIIFLTISATMPYTSHQEKIDLNTKILFIVKKEQLNNLLIHINKNITFAILIDNYGLLTTYTEDIEFVKEMAKNILYSREINTTSIMNTLNKNENNVLVVNIDNRQDIQNLQLLYEKFKEQYKIIKEYYFQFPLFVAIILTIIYIYLTNRKYNNNNNKT